MINFAAQKYEKNLEKRQKLFKNIMSDFTATHNPFNQNLNYEKILRFSPTKVITFLLSPNILQKKYTFFCVK